MSFHSLIGTCITALLTLVREGAAYAVLVIMLLNGGIGVGDFIFLFGAIVGISNWLLP